MTARERWLSCWRLLVSVKVQEVRMAILGDGGAMVTAARVGRSSEEVVLTVLWEDSDGNSWNQTCRIPIAWCSEDMMPVVEVMRA